MLDQLLDLYESAGAYGDPIAFVTLGLFLVGSVMLFLVRLVKRFILYTIIALFLPNSIGVVGYLDYSGDMEEMQESVMERGEKAVEEMQEAIENREMSPLVLGLIGSAVAAVVGFIGMVRGGRRKKGD